MNAKQFLKEFGKERAVKVAEKVGISYGYFGQYVTGVRRPSVEMAEKLVKASDGDLDFVSLLKAKAA